MDYEYILEEVGGCGRFQILAFFVLSASTFKLAIDIESLVFYAYSPKFSCANPWNDTFSNQTCQATLTDEFPFNTSLPLPTKCKEWRYDDSIFRKNVITEFDLVCDRKQLAPLNAALYFGGSIVGMVIGGFADYVGRRKLLLIQAAWDAVFSIALVFLPIFELNIAARFVKGFSAGIYYNGLTYVLEIVSAKYRMNLGSNYWVLWCLGYGACAGFGKLLKDWRLMQAVSSLCSLVYITYFFLPESPRWLILKGRKREAADVLEKIARWNGRTVVSESFLDVNISKEPSGRVWEMFSTKWMAIKTITSWILLWCCACAYMGISLHATFASDDIFVNMALMGLIELPASPFAWLISDRFGRRKPLLLTILVTAACLFAVPFAPKAHSWIRAILAVLGKFTLTAAYIIADICITECFPTSIRSLGLFTSSMWSNIAFMVTPYILTLNDPYVWLPEIILATQFLFSLIAPIVFPETKGAPLLQTVAEADLFIRGQEHLIHEKLEALRKTNDGANMPLVEKNNMINDQRE